MKNIFFSALCLGFFSNIICMTDEELEKVKQMVDQELAKRQMDVILASPNKLVAKSTNNPKNTQITLTSTTPTTTKATSKDPHWESQNSIDNCLDMYGTTKCRSLIDDWHMDCDKDRMHEMCEKSCKYCGNPVNPLVDCKKGKYGCCNDELTPKKDPFGSNCPRCKDNDPELCKDHEDDCNEVGLVGEWMRTNCAKTCSVCEESKNGKSGCQDDPEQAQFCSAWKDEGLCTQIPELMNAHCPKTCGKC